MKYIIYSDGHYSTIKKFPYSQNINNLNVYDTLKSAKDSLLFDLRDVRDQLREQVEWAEKWEKETAKDRRDCYRDCIKHVAQLRVSDMEVYDREERHNTCYL